MEAGVAITGRPFVGWGLKLIAYTDFTEKQPRLKKVNRGCFMLLYAQCVSGRCNKSVLQMSELQLSKLLILMLSTMQPPSSCRVAIRVLPFVPFLMARASVNMRPVF